MRNRVKLLDYYLAEFGRILVSKLPLNVSYAVGANTGGLIYRVWPRGRRNMIRSIASIAGPEFDETTIRTTARCCMRNFGKYTVDILRYARAERELLWRNIKIKGLENLDNALKEKNGVIMVGFHLGNLDLGPRMLGSLGYHVNAVVNHLCSRGVDHFLQNTRSTTGVKLLNVNESPSHFLELLRRNEILALLIDSPRCQKGVRVRLGRTWVTMPTGASTLSLRTGAPIIPSGLVRISDTTFEGIIGKPVRFQPSGKVSQDIRELTQRTVSDLESLIRPFMDQWYVFHPLFKPAPEPDQETTGSNMLLLPTN